MRSSFTPALPERKRPTMRRYGTHRPPHRSKRQATQKATRACRPCSLTCPYSFRNGTPLVFPVSPHLLLLLPLIAKIQSLAILPTRPPNSPRLKLFWGRKNRKQDTPPEEPRRISRRSMLPPSHRAVTQQEPPTFLLPVTRACPRCRPHTLSSNHAAGNIIRFIDTYFMQIDK